MEHFRYNADDSLIEIPDFSGAVDLYRRIRDRPQLSGLPYLLGDLEDALTHSNPNGPVSLWMSDLPELLEACLGDEERTRQLREIQGRIHREIDEHPSEGPL